MHHATTLRCLALSAAMAHAGPAVLAQKVTFQPSLDLGRAYSDNLEFTADATESDSAATIRLSLPVTREWRTGRFDFRYEPTLLRYDDRDDLDRDEHELRFILRGEPRRGTKYRLTTRFRSTQLQGAPDSTDDADLFVARRTDRQIALADFTTEVRLNSLWAWELGLGGSRYEYKASGRPGDTSPSSAVEDRTETRGTVRFSRNLKAVGSNIGFELAHSDFDLDVTDDATVDSIRLVYNRRLGRHASASLVLGAFQIDSQDEDQDNNGVEVLATLTRRYRDVSLTLLGRSAPSSGGALRGASTNTVLWLSLGNSAATAWNWRISPRIAERDSNDPATATLRTLTVGGEVSRSIHPQLRLRLRANRIDQNSDDPTIPDREASTAEFSLQWFPRGGARSNR